jgi:hypothetical protein
MQKTILWLGRIMLEGIYGQFHFLPASTAVHEDLVFPRMCRASSLARLHRHWRPDLAEIEAKWQLESY